MVPWVSLQCVIVVLTQHRIFFIMLYSLEPKFPYLSYLGLEVTSSALVGLNAFLARPNLLIKDQVGCSGNFIGTIV